jgi:hypothetical protein
MDYKKIGQLDDKYLLEKKRKVSYYTIDNGQYIVFAHSLLAPHNNDCVTPMHPVESGSISVHS